MSTVLVLHIKTWDVMRQWQSNKKKRWDKDWNSEKVNLFFEEMTELRESYNFESRYI